MASRNQSTSLRGLRTFCVVARQGSFRAAADYLFITASAVSHQIRALEDELGAKLFDRLNRSIVLTEAGSSLYDDLSPLITEIDNITSRHRLSDKRTVLRISVQPFFASELFVPGLNEFTQRHPEVDIKIDTSDESAEKHPASADVSIRVFKTPPDSLAYNRLFPLRLVPAASPGFRDRLKKRAGQIVSEFPLLVHESRANAWKKWESESGVTLPGRSKSIRLDSMIAIARAAERGLGAALVPVQLSDSWFESGALVRLFDFELQTEDAYYFVCRHEDSQTRSVQQLRSWVLQKFDDSR